jgi:hypothetical protein
VVLGHLDGVDAILGAEDLIALFLKLLFIEQSDILFIFHDEDAFHERLPRRTVDGIPSTL